MPVNENHEEPTILTEADAARLWRRAAELQAEAARRLEDRSKELAPRGDRGATEDPDGYDLSHVVGAAVEAGISPEFVEFAVAELRNERRLATKDRDLIDRLADFLLGNPPRSAEVSRVMRASPDRVFLAMQRVFPAEPYGLVLKDTHGSDPLTGGVLVFDVPAWTGLESSERLAYQARGWADIRRLYVTLTPLETEPPSCEVTIRTPLRHSRRVNFWGSAVMSGFTGAGGAAAGLAIGLTAAGAAGLAPILAGALAAASAVTVGGAVGGGAAVGYRSLYKFGLRKGLRALDGLLAALDVGIRTGWSFGPQAGSQLTLPPQRHADGLPNGGREQS
jgi:hypothetical protein